MSTIAISYGVGGPRLPDRIAKLRLLTLAPVLGSGRETTELSADISDTWSIAGKPATIVAREYRLLINGAVVFGPQPSPTIVLPAGTGGRSYSFQLRVEIAEAGGMLSSWVTLKSGTILYAAPQGTAALPDVSLSVGDPARIIDLAPYFSGTDLVYSVQSGALPASSTLIGSVLTIAATEAFGPDTILIRASNPGGTADQGLQIGITSSVIAPGVFQPGDWSVTAMPSAGAIDIAISALPSDGGSPLTGIEYRLDGGSFVAVGGSSTGTYRITGLGVGQTRLVDLRAVNGSGAGPASDARSVTTADVPAAFTSDQWSVSDLGTGSDIRITIDALPATGGASLTRLQHNIDNAGWVDFPAAPGTGNFDIPGVVAVGVQSDIAIRAGNAIGDAAQSDVKSVTTAVAPGVFQPGDWSVTAMPSAGAIDIAISALPSDGGSPLTGIEYRLDGGSFVAVGGSGTGTYRITGLGVGQTRLVDLRAVNGSGAGPASDARSVTTADVPAAFTSGQWSVSDLGTGSDIRITIDALPATGGASLTRLQHNIDNAGWVDFPAAPGTGNFDIPGVVAVGVQSDIAIRAGNAIGDAAQSDVKSITTTLGFDLTATVDGELEIDGATGEITITISSPAEYAGYDAGNGPGVFLANTADLVTGPVNLVPPRIIDDGSPDVGDTLTGVPGLWVYDGGDTAPAITQQWERGGVDISGATAISYSLVASDAGQRITLKETATGTNGTRQVTSAAVSVAGGSTNVATHLGKQAAFATATASPRIEVDISGMAEGEKLILFYNGALAPQQGVFNGNVVATSAVSGAASWAYGSERYGAVYEYTLIQGDIDDADGGDGTISIGVDLNGARTLHSMDVIHTASGSIADYVKIDTKTLTADVTPTQSNNTIFHFLGGRIERFNNAGMAYSAGPALPIYNAIGGNAGASAGIVQEATKDVAYAFTWSFDSRASGNYAGILMVIE